MSEEYILARPATLEKLHEWATSDVVPETLFVRLEDRKQQIREAVKNSFGDLVSYGLIPEDGYKAAEDFLTDELVALVYGEKQNE